MDEIVEVRTFRADVSDPPAVVQAAARGALLAAIEPRRRQRTGRRRAIAAALAVLCLLGGAGALAASGLFGEGILRGPAAPAENDAALRALFPPYRIGRATELAQHHDRRLFGARTAEGGYCFSATSPVDPKGEGGHCVSDDEADRLDAGGTAVAFAMSGWSVGGYAPGASSVRVSGAGIDATFPVGANGWWLGVAEIPVNSLPDGSDQALVVARSMGADGRVVGSDPLMLITVSGTGRARVVSVAFR